MLMLDTSGFLKGNFYFTVLQSTDPTQCIMAVMFDLYRHCSENVIVDMSDFHAQNWGKINDVMQTYANNVLMSSRSLITSMYGGQIYVR